MPYCVGTGKQDGTQKRGWAQTFGRFSRCRGRVYRQNTSPCCESILRPQTTPPRGGNSPKKWATRTSTPSTCNMGHLLDVSHVNLAGVRNFSIRAGTDRVSGCWFIGQKSGMPPAIQLSCYALKWLRLSNGWCKQGTSERSKTEPTAAPDRRPPSGLSTRETSSAAPSGEFSR
jgi:hypothetical protein